MNQTRRIGVVLILGYCPVFDPFNSLIDRMERFSESHPLTPTVTRIIELAVAEWLDKHEGELPKKAHHNI